MASIQYTKQQNQAVQVQHGNLLISAAAGSGKTAVLTGRVINLLTTSPTIPADRLLIVTFTVAAAAQMRTRIEHQLNNLIQQDPDNSILQMQQLLLPTAKICTIDALYKNFVETHAQVLGIDCDMKIASSEEMTSLKQEVMEEVFEKYYQQADLTFLSMMERLCGKDDQLVFGLVEQIYEFVRSYPFSMNYLDRFIQMYHTKGPFLQTIWGKKIKQYLLNLCKQLTKQLKWLIKHIDTDELLCKKYGPAVHQDQHTICSLEKALQQENWDGAYHVIDGYQRKRFGNVTKYPDPALQAKLKQIRTHVTNSILELKKGLLSCCEKQIETQMMELNEQIIPLTEIVRSYHNAVWQRKCERGIMEFSDLSHLALELLVTEQDGVFHKTPVAIHQSQQIDEIMVDECQDINMIQNLIFWALSQSDVTSCNTLNQMLTQPKNLFLVGDAKQSIYRFRNAVPDFFIQRFDLFPIYQDNISSSYNAKIILQENFRSRQQVVDSVNQIFSRLMHREMGDIKYDKTQYLVSSGDFTPHSQCQTELHCLTPIDSNQDKILCEANYIATKIKEMVMTGYEVQDGDQLRPCTYQDFCILLRSQKIKMDKYVNTLTQRQIPVRQAKGEHFLHSFEVIVVIHLLELIDNHMMDISLFSVLLSPMFLFSPDQLVKIRLYNRKAPLYTAVLLAANDGDKQCKNFLSFLSRLREQSIMLPMHQIVQFIYDQTRWMYLVGVLEDASKRQENLRFFLQCAQQYEKTGLRGLSQFLNYLKQLKLHTDRHHRTGGGVSSMDGVNIMTIHSSKGLEFPICIVADLHKPFNRQELNKNLLLHETYGLGMKIFQPHTLQKYTTPPREAISLVIEQEMLSEEMRILYVAMTRAKDKLILTGISKNLDKTLQRITEIVMLENSEHHTTKKISSLVLTQLSSFFEWLVATLVNHENWYPLYTGATQQVTIGHIKCIASTADVAPPVEKTMCLFKHQADLKIIEQLNQLKSTQSYSYVLQTQLPAKLSVTNFSKSKNQQPCKSLQLSSWKLTPQQSFTSAQRGTILHQFLQYADFNQLSIDLEKEINRLIQQSFFTTQEADTLNRKKLRSFAKSTLLKQLIQAEKCYREYAFLYELGAQYLLEEKDYPMEQWTTLQGETVLLQGIADAVIEETESIILIDYKTDYLNSTEEFIDRYQTQLALYAQALQQHFNKPIKSCIIYSLHLEKQIIVEI